MEAVNSHLSSLAQKQKQLAEEAFNAQKYDEAIALYTEAIKLNGRNEAYWGGRAHVYIKLEQYESAVKDASKAIEINSAYTKGFLRRGVAYYAMKNFEAALKDFQQADRMCPNDPDISRALQEECEELFSALKAEVDVESLVEGRAEVEAKGIVLCVALIALIMAAVIVLVYLMLYYQRCFREGLSLECYVIFGSFVGTTITALAINLCEMRGFCVLRRGHPAFKVCSFCLGVVACIPINFVRPITFWATSAAVLMVVWGFLVDVATDLDFGLSGVFCAVLVSIGIVPLTPAVIPSPRGDDNVAWLTVVGFVLGGLSVTTTDWMKKRFVETDIIGTLQRSIQEQTRRKDIATGEHLANQVQIVKIDEASKDLTSALKVVEEEIAKKERELAEFRAQLVSADAEMEALDKEMSGLRNELNEVKRLERKDWDDTEQLLRHHEVLLRQLAAKEEQKMRHRYTVEELHLRIRALQSLSMGWMRWIPSRIRRGQ